MKKETGDGMVEASGNQSPVITFIVRGSYRSIVKHICNTFGSFTPLPSINHHLANLENTLPYDAEGASIQEEHEPAKGRPSCKLAPTPLIPVSELMSPMSLQATQCRNRRFGVLGINYYTRQVTAQTLIHCLDKPLDFECWSRGLPRPIFSPQFPQSPS